MIFPRRPLCTIVARSRGQLQMRMTEGHEAQTRFVIAGWDCREAEPILATIHRFRSNRADRFNRAEVAARPVGFVPDLCTTPSHQPDYLSPASRVTSRGDDYGMIETTITRRKSSRLVQGQRNRCEGDHCLSASLGRTPVSITLVHRVS